MTSEPRPHSTFHKILAAYDGSPASRKAVDVAAANLAEGGTITVLTVAPLAATWIVSVPGGPLFESDKLQRDINTSWRKQVDDLVAELPPGIDSKTILAEGSAPVEIVKEIESTEYDLVVLGSRGRGAWGALFLGSVSQHVAHMSSIPVLIVPPDREERTETR